MNRGDATAKAVLLLLSIVMLDQYRRGQLGAWLRAKLYNADQPLNGRSDGSGAQGQGIGEAGVPTAFAPRRAGSRSSGTPGAIGRGIGVPTDAPAYETVPAPIVAPPERPVPIAAPRRRGGTLWGGLGFPEDTDYDYTLPRAWSR